MCKIPAEEYTHYFVKGHNETLKFKEIYSSADAIAVALGFRVLRQLFTKDPREGAIFINEHELYREAKEIHQKLIDNGSVLIKGTGKETYYITTTKPEEKENKEYFIDW